MDAGLVVLLALFFIPLIGWLSGKLALQKASHGYRTPTLTEGATNDDGTDLNPENPEHSATTTTRGSTDVKDVHQSYDGNLAVPVSTPALSTKEELEIEKLKLEINEKKIGMQFYKTPTFWFGVITAFAAIVGIIGQHYVSEAKFQLSAAEAKLAEVQKNQAETKANEAEQKAAAANANVLVATNATKAIQARLIKSQEDVKNLQEQKRTLERERDSELAQGAARQAIRAHKGEMAPYEKGTLEVFFKATDLTTLDLQNLTPHLAQLSGFRSLVLESVELSNDGLQQLADLTALQKLRLDGNPALSGSGLKTLSRFEHLEILGLSKTGIQDADLAVLKKIRHLRELNLSDTSIGDGGMLHLAAVANLHELNLTHTKVGDRGLEPLKGLQQLTNLYLSATSVTAAGLVHLSEAGRLKFLSLDDRQFTSSSIDHLKHIPNLDSLVLRGSVNDSSLQLVKQLHIHDLDARGTAVTQQGLDELKKAMPGLHAPGVRGPVDPSTVLVSSASNATPTASDAIFRKWGTGSILGVRFMDGDPTVQARVRQFAGEWTDFANVRFDFQLSANEIAPIRITFADPSGTWSFIGTDCLNLPASEPTMNLGTLRPDTDQKEFSKVVLHEFGHALGLIHEHQNPNAHLPWKTDAVYEYCQRTLGWPRESVDANILQTYKGPYREFDPKSIMMYSFPAALFDGDFETTENTTLSTSDKQFIEKLYPPTLPTVNLIVGTPAISERFDKAGQAHFFTFYAPTKSQYLIGSDGAASLLLSVFGPDTRATRVASGAAIKRVLSPGIYYLIVRHADVRGTGAYTLKITRDKER